MLIQPKIRLCKLVRSVWTESNVDNVTGLAAEMSYYFVLALFPFLIFLAAVIGMLPVTDLWGRVLRWITLYIPVDSQRVVLDTLGNLVTGRKSFLSLGLLGTAWAASGGVLCLTSALNRAYGVKETRSYWKRLALAFLMLFVLAILLLATFGLLTLGDWLDGCLAARLAPVATLAVWRLGRWLVSLFLAAVCMAILDQVLPNLKRPWRWITPGTLFIVLGWVVTTIGFNLYLQRIASYNRTYGVLGAFVVLMVWIYLASLIILVGAEINSELRKMRSLPAGARDGTSRGIEAASHAPPWSSAGPAPDQSNLANRKA